MDKKYIAFYKPFGVLSQFTHEGTARTLSEFEIPKNVYAAGRLDKDSEGLLILTNDGIFINKLTDPKNKKEKTYWVQVENEPTEKALTLLREGPIIKGNYKCLPCKVKMLIGINLPPRDPPIRERKSIPTAWVEVKIVEGKNRQVRRMCAAVGFPCLRLVRVSVGKLELKNLDLSPGEWVEVSKNDILIY